MLPNYFYLLLAILIYFGVQVVIFLRKKNFSDKNSEKNQKIGEDFEISVPQPDLRPKLRDKYRFTIMLKGKSVKSMLQVIDPVLAEFSQRKGVILTVDVNP